MIFKFLIFIEVTPLCGGMVGTTNLMLGRHEKVCCHDNCFRMKSNEIVPT